MTIKRYTFPISIADTGLSQGDTGQAFFGKLHQISWSPTVADTGGSLTVVLCPTAGDTAGGKTILTDEDAFAGPGFFYQPTIPQVQSDGFDTGIAGEGRVPIVGAGDHLRIKAVAAAAPVAGVLRVWIDED